MLLYSWMPEPSSLRLRQQEDKTSIMHEGGRWPKTITASPLPLAAVYRPLRVRRVPNGLSARVASHCCL